MATFGYLIQGGNTRLDGDEMNASLYPLAEAGDVTKLSIYLKRAGIGNLQVTLYIYDNVGNKDLMVSSAERDFTGSALDNWYDFNVAPPVQLTAGDYWLAGWFSDPVIRYYDAGAANQYGYDDPLVYGGAPPDPWVPDGYVARQLSIYAVVSTGRIRRPLLGVGR